jgi:hypothetical protein
LINLSTNWLSRLVSPQVNAIFNVPLGSPTTLIDSPAPATTSAWLKKISSMRQFPPLQGVKAPEIGDLDANKAFLTKLARHELFEVTREPEQPQSVAGVGLLCLELSGETPGTVPGEYGVDGRGDKEV